MLKFKQKIIFTLLATSAMQLTAQTNTAMSPIVSYLLSSSTSNVIQYCPSGSKITTSDTDAGYARVGAEFSSTMYDPSIRNSSNNTHNPKKLTLKVTDSSGNPVEGCRVYFEKTDGNGWIYPDSNHTGVNGELKASWIAGPNQLHKADAVIITKDNITESVSFEGTAEPHSSRANSIHINYDITGTYDRFKVDVTPITFPETTYYSAINFPGGYCGIQNRNNGNHPKVPKDKWIIFSVWDTANVDAEIIYHNENITQCEGFGGEGTGAKCHIEYDWKINDTYRFELEVTYPVASRTDYTLYFTDVDKPSQAPIKIATLRYGAKATPWYASGFIEDWWKEGSSCLETKTRAAYFHNAKYKKGSGDWIDVVSSGPSAVYKVFHNEICKNYYFGSKDSKFLWSTGGTQYISKPFLENYSPPKVTLD